MTKSGESDRSISEEKAQVGFPIFPDQFGFVTSLGWLSNIKNYRGLS